MNHETKSGLILLAGILIVFFAMALPCLVCKKPQSVPVKTNTIVVPSGYRINSISVQMERDSAKFHDSTTMTIPVEYSN